MPTLRPPGVWDDRNLVTVYGLIVWRSFVCSFERRDHPAGSGYEFAHPYFFYTVYSMVNPRPRVFLCGVRVHSGLRLNAQDVFWCGARLGRTDCNVFRYSPPSRPLGSLTPTQPVSVTNPTQGHPGSPWGAPQVECWSLRREPQPPAQHGSSAAERCRSRARPGQRLPPCMHSGGTSRHLLVTSPKRARAI